MSALRTWVAAGLLGAALAGPAAAAATTVNDEAEALTRTRDFGLVREIRLALVCYGGSSLAIYIHGNAKELHRLVLASKALQVDVTAPGSPLPQYMADRTNLERPKPGPEGRKLTGSTRVWYDRLLDVWLHDDQRVRTRVVVDVIAGTSAGGINGVILAKALAHDLSQDGLTELWMDKASLRRLTDNYFGLFRIFGGGAPVNGKALARWLYEALDGMDREAASRRRNPSLLPKGDRLDLFVTTTDLYGYPQQVVINDPALAAEKHFPHVLHFIYSGENRGCESRSGADGLLDDFCPEWTPALAFSARASSSIPGVFPPLSLGATLDQFNRLTPPGQEIAGVEPPAPLERVVRRIFRNYQLQEPKGRVDFARDTFFVDGGVLDNHPFGPAVAEVLRRPNDQEVKRFLLYLQPDPGGPPAPPNGHRPGLLGTIWKGLSGIPSQQPILNDLNAVAAYNENVRRIRDIVHAEEVAAQAIEKREKAANEAPDCAQPEGLTVAQRFGCAAHFNPANLEHELMVADQEKLRGARQSVEEAAEKGVTDLAGRSYYSLRVHSVLDQFVEVIASDAVCNYPPESAHRALVARIVERWAQTKGLIDDPEAPEGAQDPIAQKELQKSFLEDFDLGYQRRQLRFVTDWINRQYTAKPPPTREERQSLDELKAAAAKRIEELSRLIAGNDPDPEMIAQGKALKGLFESLNPWQRREARRGARPARRGPAAFAARRPRPLLPGFRDEGAEAAACQAGADPGALLRLPLLGPADLPSRRLLGSRRAGADRGRPAEPRRCDPPRRRPGQKETGRRPRRPLRRLPQAPRPGVRLRLGPPRRGRAPPHRARNPRARGGRSLPLDRGGGEGEGVEADPGVDFEPARRGYRQALPEVTFLFLKPAFLRQSHERGGRLAGGGRRSLEVNADLQVAGQPGLRRQADDGAAVPA
jgi:patatin-related protein